VIGSRERLPFVGRQHELAAMWAHLEAVHQGHGAVLFLAGEPGIGKTRLLLEFGERAGKDGWVVLAGRAYDSEGMPSYLPVAEALREYVRRCSLDELCVQLGDNALDVARVVPDVRRRLTDLPESPAAGTDTDRYRLFEAISEFLAAIARARPARGLLLLLDDLHWADKPSLLLILHLARRLAGIRLLVAGAYRTVELSRGHPLAVMLADLRREGMAERMLLPPLPREAIAVLVEAMAGSKPSAEIVNLIAGQTDGNPFFVRELTLHLKAEGIDLAGGTTVDWSIPEGVREVVNRRLLPLGQHSNRVLQAASVLGGGFSFQVLQAMSGMDEELLLDAIDEAVRVGLLREDGEGYVFAHALIREALCAGLGGARRRRLHLRAADALAAVYAGNPTSHLAEIAEQYRLSGPLADPAKAIDFARRAGDAASAVFAYEQALVHYQTALQGATAAAAEAHERIALVELLAQLTRVIGFDHYSRAITYWEEAVRLCEANGLAQRAAQARCHLGAILCAPNTTQDVPAAMAYFQQAETVLSRMQDDPSLALLHRGLGAAATWAARTSDGLLVSQRGIELGQHVGDQGLSTVCEVHHGWHLVSAGCLADGFAQMEHAWRRADGLDRTYEAYVSTSWLGNRYFLLGDPIASAECYERELEKKRLAAAPTRRLALVASLAAARAREGDLVEARRLLSQLAAHTFDQDSAMLAQALVAFWSGDWQSALAMWSTARERNRRSGNRWGDADFACWLAHLRHLQGDAAGAAEAFNEALAIGLDGPIVPVEVKARVGLALIGLETGALTEARSHVSRCREILNQGEDWRGLAGRVALAEAVALAAGGAHGPAEARFAEAIQHFRHYTLPWEEAETLRWWGRALARAGRPTEANDKLNAAAAIHERYGAGAVWMEEVISTRPRVGTDRGLHPSGPVVARLPTYPDGLSEREVQVVRLIAAGKSNREIAQALVISRNTVERHVNHILAKTGATNRTQVAGYAHRHRLIA
jgi:DNA-binding CsgD family transcriptional regulator/tetratricopeptide (TPR) repeat protein